MKTFTSCKMLAFMVIYKCKEREIKKMKKNQELKKQLFNTLVDLKIYYEEQKKEYSKQDDIDEELEKFLEKSVETIHNLIDLATWLEEE